MTSIASIERITPTRLSSLLRAGGDEVASIAVVDVRDEDYIGGHIRGAINVPSQTLLSNSGAKGIGKLVKRLEEKEVVVFHCALSQQRGPSVALKYLREKEKLKAKEEASEQLEGKTKGDDGAGEGAGGGKGQSNGAERKEQKVYVLDRGFVGWQELYGVDEQLTEGYSRALWKDGYNG